MVITVTDEQSAQTPQSGAVAKMVRYSGAQLASVTDTLNKEAQRLRHHQAVNLPYLLRIIETSLKLR